jgi:dihydrofolate reductase
VGKLIYSMGVSLDGFIAGPEGDFAWSAPDEELHRFHNQQTGELGAHLCGRKLYETMVYWETEDPNWSDYAREFAEIWQGLPKIVFSRTLTSVEGNARLAEAEPAAEVARLREEVETDIAVGGAGLASSLVELGLIDEYRPFIYPVVVGGGTPFFPPIEKQIDLELVETRTFASRVVYLRYRVRAETTRATIGRVNPSPSA